MEQKMAWTLEDDGDGIERRWSNDILPTFPKYEEFWREHIVPLTFRSVDRRLLYVRTGVPEEMQTLATAHYSVFLRLAFAAETLAGSDVKRLSGVYHFYVDLYAAYYDMLNRFLGATKNVLEKYCTYVPTKKDRRMNSWGDSGLFIDYEKLLKEVKDYRDAIHDPVMVMISGCLPKPEKIARTQRISARTYRNLADLARLLSNEAQAKSEYVDAKTLPQEHFKNCTVMLDRIWGGIIGEFQRISANPSYNSDQSAVSAEDHNFLATIPPHEDLNIFSSTPASGCSDIYPSDIYPIGEYNTNKPFRIHQR
jgi:hypothetical protein